jgi:hypothetical protein
VIIIPLWACVIAAVAGFALLQNERFGEDGEKPNQLQSWLVWIALFGAATNFFAHLPWYWAVAVGLLCYGAGNWLSMFFRRPAKYLSWLAPITVIAGLVQQYSRLQ